MPKLAAGLAVVVSLAVPAVVSHHYLITSTSQIKPSVLRTLRRPVPIVTETVTGATGPRGPAGAQGVTGPSGVSVQGPEGKPGPQGVGTIVVKGNLVKQPCGAKECVVYIEETVSCPSGDIAESGGTSAYKITPDVGYEKPVEEFEGLVPEHVAGGWDEPATGWEVSRFAKLPGTYGLPGEEAWYQLEVTCTVPSED
jgi:hypothetical protein